MDMKNAVYWPNTDKDDLAATVLKKFEDYQEWGSSSGYFDRIQRCYDTFYGTGESGTLHLEVTRKLSHININNYKALLQRLHILVTQTKLDIEIMSRNSDSSSQLDADLGQGLINYYVESKGLGIVFSEAVLTALVCLEAWVYAPWDTNGGGDVTRDEETGKLLREGDQAYYVLTALDVARSQKIAESPWYIIRQKVNKWDLAARYPEHKDVLLNATVDDSLDEYCLDPTSPSLSTEEETDIIYQYVFFHNKTDAVPDGRQVLIAGETVLEEGDLSEESGGYISAPIFNLKAGSLLQTTIADSPGVSLVALQQGINKISTAITTNAMNTSLNALWSPDPSMSITDTDGQLKMITSGIKPEVIDFSSTNDGAYRTLDFFLQQQQLLSGVNDAARGDAGKSQSGTSLSLLLAVAIQHVQDLQKGYERLASEVGTQTIRNTQRFLKVEKMAYIVGVNRKSHAKTYKADDLRSIDRVVASLGNPATQSFAGRWEMMSNMIQYQAISDPKVIVDFLRTGNLDSATEDQFGDSMNIRSENELLRKGINPPTVITDGHAEHINKHKSVLSDPEARNDPKIVQAVTEHMLGHYQQMQNMPPDLAAILGQPPLPSQQAPIGPGGAPPQGSGPAPDAAPGDISQQAGVAQQQIDQAVEQAGQAPQ